MTRTLLWSQIFMIELTLRENVRDFFFLYSQPVLTNTEDLMCFSQVNTLMSGHFHNHREINGQDNSTIRCWRLCALVPVSQIDFHCMNSCLYHPHCWLCLNIHLSSKRIEFFPSNELILELAGSRQKSFVGLFDLSLERQRMAWQAVESETHLSHLSHKSDSQSIHAMDKWIR